MKTAARLAAITAGAIVGLGVLAGVAPEDGVVREGSGERRAALDKMELKPFPSSAWVSLDAWANGAALTPADMDGKVVLIYTWKNWHRVSTTPLAQVQKLYTRHQAAGLIVVGVHVEDEWDAAAQVAKDAGATFPIARDAGGGFRAALKVDQDPDFYVIDRAGQLRYADIETSAVDAAVGGLIAETRKQAMDYPAVLAKLRADAAARARRTDLIRQDFDLASLPEFPIAKYGPEKYEKLKWPTRWRELEEQALQIQVQPGQEDVRTISLPPVGAADWWWNGEPKLTGRAIVVYFWDPRWPASYDRVQRQMELLAQERSRDVAVVGVVTRMLRTENAQQNPSEDEKDREAWARAVLKTRTERIFNHPMVIDADLAILSSLIGNVVSGQRTFFVPFAAVMSSDLTMRWMGPPTDTRFDAALDKVLAVDPAVQERRRLDAEYIRTHTPGG